MLSFGLPILSGGSMPFLSLAFFTTYPGRISSFGYTKASRRTAIHLHTSQNPTLWTCQSRCELHRLSNEQTQILSLLASMGLEDRDMERGTGNDYILNEYRDPPPSPLAQVNALPEVLFLRVVHHPLLLVQDLVAQTPLRGSPGVGNPTSSETGSVAGP